MYNGIVQKGVLAVAAVMFTGLAFGTNTDLLLAQRAARTAPVKQGQWHADLEKARAYAEANGLPLVAVWSNGDYCTHCLKFEGAAAGDVFANWMKDSGIVFYFGAVNDGSYNYDGGTGPSPDGKEGYHGTSFYWCRNYNVGAMMNWPYIRIYWPAGGVDSLYSGAEIDGESAGLAAFPCNYQGRTDPAHFTYPEDYKTYNPASRYMINFLTTGPLVNWKYNPYSGGEFGCGNAATNPDACLELEYGTTQTSVIVPLTRKDANSQTSAARNYLRTVFPNGSAVTNTIDWAAGESYKDVVVNFNPSWVKDVGKVYYATLELYSDKVEIKETNYIRFVDPVENTPKNPRWIGERTADTLGWGEWTMDIDAATNKVASARAKGDANAYTLILNGGSLWCPDCMNFDKYVIDTAAFRTWAGSTRHIACVAVDIPPVKMDLRAPTLLSHERVTGSMASYFSASGSGYLSRHGVPLHGNGGVNAAVILERNIGFVNNPVSQGGFALDDYTSSSRPIANTSVPTLILLRSDGSVAGRIYQFAKDSSALSDGSAAVVIKRLEELLSQADDLTEEKNDTLRGTNGTVSRRELKGVEATLSFSDQVDYYRIDAEAYSTITFDLGVVDGGSQGQLVVSVLNGDLANPDASPVMTVTNSFAHGVSGTCELPSGNCYFRIGYPLNDKGFPVDSKFAFTNGGSTLVRYRLTTDVVLYPSELFVLWTIAKDAAELAKLGEEAKYVSVGIENGRKYRFTGIDADDASVVESFDYDVTDDTYEARVSDDAFTFRLVVNETTGGLDFGYQQWRPGVIGFDPAGQQSVKERGDDEEDSFVYEVMVARKNGGSGAASARIRLTYATELGTEWYVWEHEDEQLTWEEGDMTTRKVPVTIKSDSYADGVKSLFFELIPVLDGDYTTPVDEKACGFTLDVIDDDKAVPGEISLVSTVFPDEDASAIPANRTVVAKGGTKLTLVLKRDGGTDGALQAAAYVGEDIVGSVAWEGRQGGERQMEFDVPAYDASGENLVQIRVDGLKGAKVTSSAKYLTIRIVPSTAIEFNSFVMSADYVRYVRHADFDLVLNSSTYGIGDDVEVRKIAGSLPPGVVWSFDGERVTISGVATQAGEYSAVFQGVANGVPGGTAQLTISVTDPATPKSEYEAARNPWLANTRTVSDIMVIDKDKERLIGLLTVTIPRSGRLSGKYRPLEGEPVSLMADCWENATNGNYFAALEGVSDPEYSCEVTACADGAVDIVVDVPGYDAGEILVRVPEASAWSERGSAEPWRGYYTVSLPIKKASDAESAFASGDGFVTVRMTDDAAVKAGRMTYAGMFANGKAFSGSAVLDATGMGSAGHEALLPLFTNGGEDLFSAVLLFDPDVKCQEVSPYVEAYPYWKHVEKVAGAGYTAKLDVFGCRYVPSDIVKSCQETFKTEYVFFYALPEKIVDNNNFAIQHPYAPVEWKTNNIYGIGLAVSKAADGGPSITRYSPSDCEKEHGLMFSFDRETGIVSGSCWLDFYETPTAGTRVNASFRGIVMPGWGSKDGCGACADRSTEDHPFISGACYFYDTYEYDSAWGPRKLSVKRGCPFSVGVAPGK